MKISIVLMCALLLGTKVFSQNITGYEYWFDYNFAGRTLVNEPNGSIANLTANINTEQLTTGYHTFNFRTKSSDGKWSVPVSRSFVNGKNFISGIEYWYDGDYSTKAFQAQNENFGGNYVQPLPINNLSVGTHTISICFVDIDGIRSVPITASFFANENSAGVNDFANNFKVKVFPNPATNEVFITELKDYTQLTLTDLNGRILLQRNLSNTNMELLDLRLLSAGTYLLILNNNEKIVQQKLVKTN